MMIESNHHYGYEGHMSHWSYGGARSPRLSTHPEVKEQASEGQPAGGKMDYF